MRRDLPKLAQHSYDLVVIGGGINGAFAAWDAALRGLSVALLEKADFGHATSSASSKVIHGGIRFLQKGDILRMRESVRERKTFMRIAPHIVHPIPFLIPTYGHLMRGKEILTLGMMVYDLVGVDRNTLDDPEKRIPGFRLLSRKEVLRLEPNVADRGLTGGVRYYDCHMHNSERMTLAVILSAFETGAQIANYAEVTGFLERDRRVTGVKVRDAFGGDEFDVQARVVVNASGPWAYEVLAGASRPLKRSMVGLSKGIHMVTRQMTHHGALALATKQKNEALINRGGRHFFMIPWRGHSLIGTTNVPFRGRAGELRVTEKDISEFIDEVKEVYPAGALRREDVTYAFTGLYPLVDKSVKTGVYQGGGKEYVLNHAVLDGIEGVITVIGTKYTTARNLGRKAVDLAFAKLGKKPPKAMTGCTAVYGGRIERFEEFVTEEKGRRPHGLDEEVVTELILNYGMAYPRLLKYLDEESTLDERVTPDQPAIKAAILHGVREEMGMTLRDILFRRTGLGTLGEPGDECLKKCAAIMAAELNWSKSVIKKEIAETKAAYEIQAE